MIKHLSYLPTRLLLKKIRHTTTLILGIALGVAVIIAAFGLSKASIKQLSASFDVVLGKADLVISGNEPFDEQVISKSMQGLPIDKKASQLSYRVRIKHQKKLINSKVTAINSKEAKNIWKVKILKGKFNISGNNFVISNSLASQLDVQVGDQIKVFSGAGVTNKNITGILSDIGLGSQNSVFTNLKYAQKNQGSSKITSFFISLKPSSSLKKVEKTLKQRLPSNMEVGKMPAAGNYIIYLLGMIKTLLLIIGAFALIIGIFLIYQTTLVTSTQRTPMISLLKSFGATRRQLISLFLWENLIIGLIASLIGVALGGGISFGISRLISTVVSTSQPSPVFSVNLLFVALIIGILVSLIATLIPVIKATSMPVISGLRNQHNIDEKASITGLFSKILSVTNHLIRKLLPQTLIVERSLAFHWRRYRLITIALIVSISVLVGVQIGAKAMQKTVSDFFIKGFPLNSFTIRPQSMIGMGYNSKLPPSKINQIKNIKGVGRISPYTFGNLTYKGKQDMYMVVTTEEADNFVIEKGNEKLAKKRFKQGGWIVVSQNFAPNVKIGESIKLDIAGRSHSFKVAAIVVQVVDRPVMSWPDARRYFNLTQAAEVAVFPSANTSFSMLKSRLKKYVDKEGFTILTGGEARNQMNGMTKGFTLTITVLISAILLIVSLGIANMMMVNSLNRVRVLGVIKSLGMKRRQLVRLLASESLMIGIFSLVPGLILGRLLGQFFISYIANTIGMDIKATNVFESMILVTIIVSGILYATALFPARRIAKITVSDALRYE